MMWVERERRYARAHWHGGIWAELKEWETVHGKNIKRHFRRPDESTGYKNDIYTDREKNQLEVSFEYICKIYR